MMRKMKLFSPGAYSVVRGVRFFISKSQRLALQKESLIVGVLVKVIQRNRSNGRDRDRDHSMVELHSPLSVSPLTTGKPAACTPPSPAPSTGPGEITGTAQTLGYPSPPPDQFLTTSLVTEPLTFSWTRGCQE